MVAALCPSRRRARPRHLGSLPPTPLPSSGDGASAWAGLQFLPSGRTRLSERGFDGTRLLLGPHSAAAPGPPGAASRHPPRDLILHGQSLGLELRDPGGGGRECVPRLCSRTWQGPSPRSCGPESAGGGVSEREKLPPEGGGPSGTDVCTYPTSPRQWPGAFPCRSTGRHRAHRKGSDNRLLTTGPPPFLCSPTRSAL